MSKQEALPPWAEIQKKTFTNWVNVHLAERQLRIENLALDLSDGLKLINLLEQISAKRLPKYTKVVKFHNQKLENVGIALKFLKDEGLKLVAIGPEDVVECRIKLILGLIWTIILRWQIQKISYQEGSPGSGEKGGDSKAELLAWVNRVIPKNPVRNLNKDWQDGKALAALTNYLRPNSVKVAGDEEPLELVTKAVRAAEKIKVHAVISPEDIISPHLDDLSMMTYVSIFREREAQLKVPDPTKFDAFGPGLRTPVARKKNKFTVVAKNSEGARLGTGGLLISSKYASKAHLQENEPHYQPTKVKDNRTGEYSLGYVPTSPGEYVIYVTWQEYEIAGSPFTVTVSEPTIISAEHSTVDPEAKHYPHGQDETAPRKFYFTVTTRHNNGSPVTHGGAALVAAIFPEGGDELSSVVEDDNDGTYKVVFDEPQAEGEFTVAIGLAGESGDDVLEHVSGSPFTFTISADGHVVPKPSEHKHVEPPKEEPKIIVATISPKKSVVETHLLSKPDGRKYFKVITKDDSGAQVYVPGTKLRAALSPVTKGPYYLISRLNNLVLTIPDNKTSPNEYVLTWAKKTGNANQLWYFTAEGGVENAKTGLVLDVGSDGTKIVVTSKKSRPEQGWAYNPITEIITSKRPAAHGKSEGNFALDIQHAKKQAGVNVVLFAKRHQNNNKSQRWYLSAAGKAAQSAPPPTVATFYIVSRLHGYVLGTQKPEKEQGAHVVLVEKKPASAPEHAYQLWKFTPDGFVQNVATGFVLDLHGDPEENAELILSAKKPKDNTTQKWKYNPITELLESDKEEELVIGIAGASKNEGVHAILTPKKAGKSPAQHWYLVPSAKGDNAVVPNVAAHVPVEFVDNQDGTYEVVFVPDVAGSYDVSVGLPGDETPGEEEGPIVHFEHSPFVTEINPAAEISPEHSTISHVPIVLPNGDNVFRVNLKDKDGKPIPFSGVPIVAHIFAKKPHGKDEPVPVFVADLGGGAFDVVLKPTAGSGPYHVDIGLPKDDQHPNEIGIHLGGAPFDVKIDLGSSVDPSKSTVDRVPLARIDPVPRRRKSKARSLAGPRSAARLGARQGEEGKLADTGKHGPKHGDAGKHGDEHKPAHGDEGKHGDEHGHKHGDEHGPKHGDEHGPKHGDEHGPKHGDEHGPKHGDEHGPKHGDEHGHKHGDEGKHGDDDAHGGEHKPKHGDDEHKHGHGDEGKHGDEHKPGHGEGKHGDEHAHKHGDDDDEHKPKHGHDDEHKPKHGDEDKHKHGHDDEHKPKHGHDDEHKPKHGHDDEHKPKHGHDDEHEHKPKHGDDDDDDDDKHGHKHGDDDDKHGHKHGDDDKHGHKHGDVDKQGHEGAKPGHDEGPKRSHAGDEGAKSGHDDQPKHGHAGDEAAKRKKPSHRRPKKARKAKKEDDSDSSSSSSSSSSESDSDSDGDGDRKDKKEKKPKKGVATEHPPFVKRVWRARAKDAEGKPLNYGGAPIAARAKDADGAPLPVTVEDNKDGTYDVVVSVPYSESDSVPVILEVGLSDNLDPAHPGTAHIAVPFGDTPFTAQVSTDDSKARPEAVLELDLAPKFSRKSNAPYFVVRSKDKHGHPLKRGGLPVVAQLANLEDVPESLEGVLERLADTDDREALLLALSHSKPAPLTVKDKHDGTYRIVLNDPTSGDFVLDLGFGDPASFHPSTVLDRSPDLPVLVSIDLGDSDALGDLDISKSEADLSQFGEDQLADGSIYFPVITKDSNGEPILTGGAPIAAAVSVSGRRGETAIPVKVIDNGDGTYNVAFVPTKLPGTYSIAVGLEDEDGHLDKNKDNQIKDFPLLVKLGPGVYDNSSPLAKAAESFALKPELKHKPEDGEGGIGFDIEQKPGQDIDPELLEALGAALAAQVIDEDGNVVPATIHDLGNGKARVSLKPKPNKQYAIGVALVDPEKNAAEIAGSPFLIDVDADGNAEIVGPLLGVDDGYDEDTVGDTPVTRGGKGQGITEAAPVDSPFDQHTSPYHTLPQRPKYAKAVEAPSPQATKVDGEGLHHAIPNKESTFTIHPKSEAGHPITVSPSLFKAKATGPNGEEAKVKLSANPDGSITGSYTPKASGPLKLDVEVADPTGKFHPVHGFPATVDVAPTISANKSKISGPGITDFDTPVTNKVRNFFIIETYDNHGARKTVGGEKFEVKINPPSLISSIVNFFIHPEIIDNGDGTYTVWYQPRDEGKHTINVKYQGEHVGASPIAINVEEGTDEEETIAVDYMFTIEARTVRGIPRNRGGDKFLVEITGPEGPITDIHIEDLAKAANPQPGKYRVFYTLPGKGKYVIRATINGKDIKGSPWRQKL